MSYDRALNRFSFNGRLFQTEYAMNAVSNGATVLAIQSEDMIVIAVEKQDLMQLQQIESVSKVCILDDHVMCGYAGMNSDARVLFNKAQIECQSHRLTFEDPISIERIARYIATIQLRYTQIGGVRPFGVASLICGFDTFNKPHIYETIPCGSFSEWKARSIGKFGHPAQEYLEKLYVDGLNEYNTLKIAIGAMREIADCRPKNIGVTTMKPNEGIRSLTEDEIQSFVTDIESR